MYSNFELTNKFSTTSYGFNIFSDLYRTQIKLNHEMSQNKNFDTHQDDYLASSILVLSYVEV